MKILVFTLLSFCLFAGTIEAPKIPQEKSTLYWELNSENLSASLSFERSLTIQQRGWLDTIQKTGNSLKSLESEFASICGESFVFSNNQKTKTFVCVERLKDKK